MEKIYDIQGYNIINEDIDYDSLWVGKVLLNDNGTIEGVSTDGVTYKLHLIKGKLTKNYIELYNFSYNDQEVCKRFNCIKKKNVYDGSYNATDSFTSVQIGECTLKVIPADKTREVSTAEIISLKEKIELLKSHLGKEGEKIYSNIDTPQVNNLTKKIK